MRKTFEAYLLCYVYLQIQANDDGLFVSNETPVDDVKFIQVAFRDNEQDDSVILSNMDLVACYEGIK